MEEAFPFHFWDVFEGEKVSGSTLWKDRCIASEEESWKRSDQLEVKHEDLCPEAFVVVGREFRGNFSQAF